MNEQQKLLPRPTNKHGSYLPVDGEGKRVGRLALDHEGILHPLVRNLHGELVHALEADQTGLSKILKRDPEKPGRKEKGNRRGGHAKINTKQNRGTKS